MNSSVTAIGLWLGMATASAFSPATVVSAMTPDEFAAVYPVVFYWIRQTIAEHEHSGKIVASMGFKRLPLYFSQDLLSERTKAALAAAKRRGTRLGNPNLPQAAKRGVAALKANARQFAANVRPIIEDIMRAGATSHNQIATKLNERNVKTARGGRWTHVQVGAILHPFEVSAAVT
jgi:hypothetical protein